MASGNQIIQDYATIQNQLGDYFNTITLNVSSISTFGTLGTVGNQIVLYPDGGSVDVSALPNITTLNTNTSAISFSAGNTLFTSDIEVLDKTISITLIGSSNKSVLGNDNIKSFSFTADDGIEAGGAIRGNELNGQIVYTNMIKDSSEKTFFTWDSATGNTSTIATAAHFSTITYDELNPAVSVNMPSAYISASDIISIGSPVPTLVNHSPITTDKSGYTYTTVSVEFHNISPSQDYNVSAYIEITDLAGSNIIYTQTPMTATIPQRIGTINPSQVVIPLTLRCPSTLSPGSYNIAVYATASDSNATITSTRCDINTFMILDSH